jgi:hypothetical protein
VYPGPLGRRERQQRDEPEKGLPPAKQIRIGSTCTLELHHQGLNGQVRKEEEEGL